MAKVSDKFKMEGITFIAHGGPGSGRYPKGSGKKYLKKKVKALNKAEKERARVYTDYKYSVSKNERERLNKKEKELLSEIKRIQQDILSKSKNVKLEDALRIDYKYMLKYPNEPFAGAYSVSELKKK